MSNRTAFKLKASEKMFKMLSDRAVWEMRTSSELGTGDMRQSRASLSAGCSRQ